MSFGPCSYQSYCQGLLPQVYVTGRTLAKAQAAVAEITKDPRTCSAQGSGFRGVSGGLGLRVRGCRVLGV